MRVPRDTIPEMRDFDESSRDESEPERDSRKGSCVTTIERTQNACRSARAFRWFHRLKNFRYSSLRCAQPACAKIFTSCHSFAWCVNDMNFTLTVKNGTSLSFFICLWILVQRSCVRSGIEHFCEICKFHENWKKNFFRFHERRAGRLGTRKEFFRKRHQIGRADVVATVR